MPPSDTITARLEALPSAPGVYLMKDRRGEIIYVGKAKSLRHRVRSYFQQPDSKDIKTWKMVGEIRDIEWIVVPSEADAYVLENTLIKKHKPHFNIMLRDDKSFPYVQITWHDAYPWAFIVRRPKADRRSLFLGPYPSAFALREVMGVINKHFTLRKCNDRKFHNRSKPCLYYQIGRCSAPCVGFISEADHRKLVEEVVMVLKKDTRSLIPRLEERMHAHAEAERYEEAARVRDQIRAVEGLIRSDTTGVVNTPVDADAWAVTREGELISIALITIRSGYVLGHRAFKHKSELDAEEVLDSLMSQYYESAEIPDEVMLNLTLPVGEVLAQVLSTSRGRKVEVTQPQRGVKHDWVEMAATNALQQLERIRADEVNSDEVLEALQRRLLLPRRPTRIECYDISNIMGTLAVGSRVVFTDGKPDKAQYRKYKIKTVEGANDFAMMREVLSRRFSGSGKEDTVPDLLVIDGGKGQLAQAVEVLAELGIKGVPTVGLAKARVESDFEAEEVDASQERVFLPNRKNPVLLKPNAAATFLLQRVRDESHRFAITYHRELRKRKNFSSVLEDIPGVGMGRRRALLRHFGSLKRVKEASREDLKASGLLTETLIERVWIFFHPKEAAD